MDKKIILILFSFFNLLLTGLYINNVIFDQNINPLYIKWIPVTLLFIQTLIFTIYYHIKQYDITYMIYLLLAYLFCISGDILLIYDEYFFYGMITFGISYLLFGLGRIDKILNIKIEKDYKLLSGILVIIFLEIAQIIIAFVLFMYKRNNYAEAIPMVIYSLFIMFSLIMHYIYLMKNRNQYASFSLIGLIIFNISDLMVVIQYIDLIDSKIFHSIEIALYWIGLSLISFSIEKILKYEYLDSFNSFN